LFICLFKEFTLDTFKITLTLASPLVPRIPYEAPVVLDGQVESRFFLLSRT
jgi:hypothetical protein